VAENAKRDKDEDASISQIRDYPSISTADLSDVDRTKGNVAVPCNGLAQATPSKSP